MLKVNLDALISREDFEVSDTGQIPDKASNIKINDLQKGAFFYSALRKPDFQRETSEWTPAKILEFIKSFLEGDLIPAIILWSAGRYIFVIDGAHRLSALLSWVHDDYGDGFISQSFFNHDIDDEQKAIAKKTRTLVNSEIGSFKEYQESVENQNKANPNILNKALRLGYTSVQLQWVSGGADKAEASFFKINQEAAPINDTEKELLKARSKPHAIAARAIIRAGTGHKYWSKFSDSVKDQIENLAKDINDSLFEPKLTSPIKTLDLPLAGKGYSSETLALIFDFIRISNGLHNKAETPDDDINGETTLQYLKNAQRIIRRISTTHPSSFGFHPAVYFYSSKGRYQHTAFLAIVDLIIDIEKNKSHQIFTKTRYTIESFLINNKHIINQITYKYGSGLKSFRHIKGLLLLLMAEINSGINETDKLKLAVGKEYPFLRFEQLPIDGKTADFSRETKSEIYINEAIKNALHCPICGGLVHKNSLTFDHIERKQDGGSSDASNGQIAHPYCNSTIKN